MGKEFACEKSWIWRSWAVGASSIANRGAPLIRGLFGIDYNRCDIWQLGVYASGLLNFGKRQLSEIPVFRGYASVQFRAVDLGLYFTIYSITIDYSYRSYAKNYPKNNQLVQLRLLIPLSI